MNRNCCFPSKVLLMAFMVFAISSCSSPKENEKEAAPLTLESSYRITYAHLCHEDKENVRLNLHKDGTARFFWYEVGKSTERFFALNYEIQFDDAAGIGCSLWSANVLIFHQSFLSPDLWPMGNAPYYIFNEDFSSITEEIELIAEEDGSTNQSWAIYQQI